MPRAARISITIPREMRTARPRKESAQNNVGGGKGGVGGKGGRMTSPYERIQVSHSPCRARPADNVGAWDEEREGEREGDPAVLSMVALDGSSLEC